MRGNTNSRNVRREKTIENYGAAIARKARGDCWLAATLPNINHADDTVIITKVFDLFEDADPTNHKEYVLWIALQYVKDHISRAEDIPTRIKQALRTYHKLKQSPLFSNRDITRLNACQLEALIAQCVVHERFDSEERGSSNEVYRDSDVRVIVPLDHMAAHYYGRGTNWCTNSMDADCIFNMYNSSGPLYILLPQSPERIGEKYQLHFPQGGQFMNEDDRPVSLSWLMHKRFKGLSAFFKTHEPLMDDYIVFTNDAVLERLIAETARLTLAYTVEEPEAFQKEAEEVLQISPQQCRSFATEVTAHYMGDPYIGDLQKVIADMVLVEFDGQDRGLSAWIKRNIEFEYDFKIKSWSARGWEKTIS
jgi:hypothetical protein